MNIAAPFRTYPDEVTWSATEKKIARKAFNQAYRRQCETILAQLKKMIARAAEPADIWKVHDYLSIQRKRTDQKYDYRYSVLLQVFARLLREGWLTEADLDGLQDDKIDRIRLWSQL